MAYLMVIDKISCLIFFSVFISVALTRRIDNPAFYIGTFIILAVPWIFSARITFEWGLLTPLIFAGVLDEIGNMIIDHLKSRGSIGYNLPFIRDFPFFGFFDFFFSNRCALKIMVFIFCFLGLFHWVYFIAFMAFDFSYLWMEKYSLSKVKKLSRLSRAGS